MSVWRVVDVDAMAHREISRVGVELEQIVVVAVDDPVGQNYVSPQRSRLSAAVHRRTFSVA